jgi:hypothetical protein
MMARDSIRAKQNAEVLDVWKDLQRQVFARERKQVAQFPQSLKPKTQRDLGVELNVDKSVEALNKTLETKLGALEFFVQNLSERPVKGLSGLVESGSVLGQIAQAYSQAINTGDVIPLWNGIARLYQTPGLSRQSQELVKVALQQLVPNLDALKYGFKSTVDFIFQKKPALITAPARVRPGPAERPEPSIEELEAPERRPSPARAAQQENPFDLPEQKVEVLPGREEMKHEAEDEDEDDPLQGEARPRGAARGRAVAPRGRAVAPRAAAARAPRGPAQEPAVDAQLSLKVLELLRTLSVYTLVRSQVDAEPRPISVQDLEAAYKNIFQSLSQQEIDFLKEEAPRGSILPRSIRNIPDFDTPDTAQRLKAIEQELGIKFPPEYYKELRKMPRDKLDQALDQARFDVRASVSKREQDQLRAVHVAWTEHKQLTSQLADKFVEARGIASFLNELEAEAGRRVFVPFVPQPLEEAPLEPEPFEYDVSVGMEENAERFARWEELSIAAEVAQQQNSAIEQMNYLNSVVAEMEDADARQQFLDSLEDRRALLRRELRQLEDRAEAAEDSAKEALDAISEGKARSGENTLNELKLYLSAIAQRPVAATVERFLEAKPREGFGKPRGCPVDSRGLASLRLNYGAGGASSSSDSDSDSDSCSSDEDALDFDDTRNEHYYTRPF